CCNVARRKGGPANSTPHPVCARTTLRQRSSRDDPARDSPSQPASDGADARASVERRKARGRTFGNKTRRLVNAARAERLFEVIFEDGDLLVINKPAGLVCHPTKSDEYSSLIARVRLHLGAGFHPHLVNRLDRETSGVTLVAKRDEVARQLRRLWEQRLV